MKESPGRTLIPTLAVTLAAIGGFTTGVGVLLGWWTASASHESEIFGHELVQVRSLLGTAHWTGVVAIALGVAVAVLALGALFLGGDGLRRASAIASFSGGCFILGAVALAFAQAASVAQEQVGGAGLQTSGDANVGLYLSALGGLAAAAGGLLTRRTSER